MPAPGPGRLRCSAASLKMWRPGCACAGCPSSPRRRSGGQLRNLVTCAPGVTSSCQVLLGRRPGGQLRNPVVSWMGNILPRFTQKKIRWASQVPAVSWNFILPKLTPKKIKWAAQRSTWVLSHVFFSLLEFQVLLQLGDWPC